MPEILTEVEQAVVKASGMHRRIVNDVWPNGVIARCPSCGNTFHLDVEETIECLANGWPKCCGRSMPVEGAKEPH